MRWLPAYVALGSNLDAPGQRVAAALQELGDMPDTRLIRVSPLYRSAPMGPVAQDAFINAAAALLTNLPVRELFAQLRQLERQLGRLPPRERWGPRHIDLDLLAYGSLSMTDPDLIVPHPGIMERNFVLYPLADIAPELQLPGMGRVADLKRAVSSEGIWRHDH